MSAALGRALRTAELRGAASAQRRAALVAGAAFAGRAPLPRHRHPTRPLALALAALLLAAAATSAVAPAREAVGHWVRAVLRSDQGRPGARAELALPSPGRLLVTSARGPWVVPRHGARRLLGDYAGASWSPHGLFVVAWRGRTLSALEPGGRPRWSLSAPGRVTAAWWSPDPGFHIAYRAGGALWVVAGNGTGAHRLARAAGVLGAWRPGPGPVFAYLTDRGTVEARAMDSGRLLWRFRASGAPRAIQWTADGRRVLLADREGLRVLDAGGRERARIALGPGAGLHSVAVAPRGARAAVVRARPGGRTDLAVVDLARPRAPAVTMLAAAGHLDRVAWSPDGRWLLVTWPRADQWLFVRAGGVHRIVAISRVARAFAPGGRAPAAGARPEGWCCAR